VRDLGAGHTLKLPHRLAHRGQIDAALRFEVTRHVDRPQRELAALPLLALGE
jgi:hypothetical protein